MVPYVPPEVGFDTVYVDDDALLDPGPGDPTLSDPDENGTTANPFDSIQEAIDAVAPGGTVVVLDGTYTGDGNRDVDFRGKAITVRSANGPENCIVDCQGTETEPRRGFAFNNDEIGDSILEGFTITGGFVVGNAHSTGGGGAIRCFYASPTIRGNVITGNTAEAGGGVGCGTDTLLRDNVITDNTARIGGGVYCIGRAVVEENTITDNVATVDGGGVACYEWNTVVDNTISGNTADHGGGVFTWEDHPATIVNNVITDNFAETSGGGIDVLWDESTVIAGNLITDNSTNGSGGGIHMMSDPAAIVNNTIVANSAAGTGDGIYGGYNGDDSTIANCIVWGNGDDLADCTATYSCVEDPDAGQGTIHTDPLFVDAATGNYRLLPGSPCINTGDNAAVPATLTEDLDGRARVVDGGVDMGAYEFLDLPVLYVDDDAPAGGDGSSWADALTNLQDALAAAMPGDEIRVAAGVYEPDEGANQTAGDRNASFQLHSDVIVQGGYAGLAALDPDVRDVAVYRTILSGDLAGDDGPDFANNGENSYQVVDGSGTDPTAVLDGFTITGGNGWFGAGMFNSEGNPTLIDCTFQANTAEYEGAGMFNQSSSPTLTRCSFIGNVGRSYHDAFGGGVYNDDDSYPALYHCRFLGNQASLGGGIYNYYAGATLVNCLFSGNVANEGGGALGNLESDATLINCTVSGNYSGWFGGGGIESDIGSSLTITNSILWGNHTADDYSEASQITADAPNISNTCVQGWTGDLGGTGNIGSYPFMVDADGYDNVLGTADDNLRLLSRSPCVDTGDTSAVPSGVVTDLDGNPRVLHAVVDMGAYEAVDVVGTLPIFPGDRWDYFKGTQQPPVDWNQASFDSSTWLRGGSGIGYGDGDDATVLDDMEGNYASVFARRTFSVVDPDSVQSLVLTVDYDDGFVAYLNGVEVARSNMDGSQPAFDATATAQHEAAGGDSQPNPPEEFDISHATDLLVSGTNVLAIQCHNEDLGSSDLSLIPSLHATYTPTTIYVDDDALFDPGPGNPGISDPAESGSIDHPFDAIQEAVDAAHDGDTVVVLDGIYTGDGNRDIDFLGKPITVRSANGPDNCVVDCQGTPSEPHRGFAFNNDEIADSILEGLTITGGYVVGNAHSTGGGGAIRCFYASPTIRGNVITGNTADAGGGVGCGSDTLLRDNVITGNTARIGGGVYCTGRAVIEENTITDNVVTEDGGGVACYEWNTVAGNVIARNMADRGGGVFLWEDYAATIVNNVISDNFAESSGGGVESYYDYEAVIAGNLIIDNSTNGSGGGIRLSSDPALVVNNTIVGNSAAAGGGGVDGGPYGPPSTITNCIVWNNGDDLAGCTATYSCVEDLDAGQGTIHADPLFVDPAGGDYRLLPGSPCIDAGDSAAVPAWLVEDLDGNARIIGSGVDMGAYERTASIIHVDDDAPTGGDGSSWDEAFKHLQDALAAATAGDVIRVAGGTYRPDQGAGQVAGDREAAFELSSGVWLVGGYAGLGHADPDARDIAAHETILSADLAGNDAEGVPSSNLYYEPTRTENAYHVLTADGVDDATRLDGVTITGGNANRFAETLDSGGGILIQRGNPMIVDCTFRANTAGNDGLGGGGAIYNLHADPTLIACTFVNNAAGYDTGGGAIYNDDSDPTLADCTFTDNASHYYGGAIYNAQSAPELTNCAFTDNSTMSHGGAVHYGYGSGGTLVGCTFLHNRATGNGGALHNTSADPSLTDCTFMSNWAVRGGAAYSDGGAPSFERCGFRGNSSGDTGGAVYLARDMAGQSPTLVDCTFAENWSTTAGGLVNVSNSPTLTNCAFLGNIAQEYGGGMVNFAASPVLTNCAFSGNTSHDYGGSAICNESGSNPTLTNCTIVGNRANDLDYGSAIFNASGSPTLINCILWANTDDVNATEAAQMRTLSGTPSVQYTCVEGWTGGTGGVGNMGTNPALIDANGPDDEFGTDDDNLRLLPGSPCIDAGDTSAIPAGVLTDLGGNPRVDGLEVDLGAYEFTQPSVIYVDADATGTGNGFSWADAYTALQDALAVATAGQTIWMAEGVYVPGTAGNRDATFALVDGVVIQGGYAGFGEPDPDARDVDAHETILSGDLAGDDGPDFSNYQDNCYHVVTGAGVGASAMLDGLTITAGNADGSPGVGNHGGGLYDGSPTVVDCLFVANSADYGGGMYATATVIDCTFQGNRAGLGGGVGEVSVGTSQTLSGCIFIDNTADLGGGAFISRYSTLTDCTFTGNTATEGGGILIDERSPTLTRCTFTENTADLGGAIYNAHSHPTLIDCTITGNTATQDGGGIYNYENNYVSSVATLIGCLLEANTAGNDGGGIYNFSGGSELTHCTLDGNTAGHEGGGIYNAQQSDPLLVNCLVVNNSAGGLVGGGMATYQDSTFSLVSCTFSGNSSETTGTATYQGGWQQATIVNCVFWGNLARLHGTEDSPVAGRVPLVSYSCIQDEDPNDGEVHPGVGNTDDDPRFVEPLGADGVVGTGDENLRLLPDSPCRNTGSNTALPAGLAVDADGNPRIAEGIVDMGAYEGPHQGLLVSTRSLVIDEGETATFTVALAMPPDGPVEVDVAWHSGDADVSVVAGGTLVFDSINYMFPQQVTLAAAEDADRIDGTCLIQLSSPGFDTAGISATEFDDDVPTVMYVDHRATGANDGSSWADAYRDLQDALREAALLPRTEEIHVAQGVYTPDGGTGDREATFLLHSGAVLRGGYAGLGHPDPNVRDVDLHETVLSGDLAGDDAPGFANYAENSFHVVTADGWSRSTELDGFTVTGGNADGSAPEHSRGGALYGGELTMIDCLLIANQAIQGGAVHATPYTRNSRFIGNAATDGGAIYSDYDTDEIILVNCAFSGNTATGHGGAVYLGNNEMLWINCSLTGNTAGSGAGIWGGEGADVMVRNSILWANRDDGGTDQSAQIDAMMLPSVSYTCLQGWTGSFGGTSNIGDDPLLADIDGADDVPGTIDDDLRLLPGSPAVDAGNSAALPGWATTDLDGQPRIDGPAVDMGAYESIMPWPDQLVFDTIASPQPLGGPFTVTITALDAAGQTLTGFYGTVDLSGWTASGTASTIVVSEVDTSSPDIIELTNVSGSDVDVSGWQVLIYDRSSETEPLPAFTLPAGSICPAGEVFLVEQKGDAPGTFPHFYTGEEISWRTTGELGVLLLDDAGAPVDFMAAADLEPALITDPFGIVPDCWQGDQIAAPSEDTVSYQRVGNTDTNTAGDWVLAAPTLGTVNPDLIVSLFGDVVPVEIEPIVAGPFVAGVWTGEATVLQEATDMFLQADDLHGHVGRSNRFDVELLPGEIRGAKWNDINADGDWDDDEPGLPGWTIYVDLDGSGTFSDDEPHDVTDADGYYAITGLAPGAYTVAEVYQTGWEQIYPGPATAEPPASTGLPAASSPAVSGHQALDQPLSDSGIEVVDVDTSWIDGAGASALGNLDWQSLAAAETTVPFSGSGVLGVYVEPGLLPDIFGSLSVYAADLAAEGYSVSIEEFAGTSADLRGELQQRWSGDALEGALFVGDLPYVNFTSEDNFNSTPHRVTYPHDLYFMDLDGTYVFNPGGLDEHIDGEGDVGPEIYVSRITTGNLGGLTGRDEATLINDYFAKVHAYRTGHLTYQNRGIVFADDDWDHWGSSQMTTLYDEVLAVNDPSETTRQGYLDTLALDYESILECIHSSTTSHSIETDSGWQHVSASQIVAANPRQGFYNMFNCSSARFTSTGYLAGAYVYGGDYGLSSVGSTKTGGMLGFSSFYRPQGEGDTVGQAFMQWFEVHAAATDTGPGSSVDWFYGMTMQGDPTLNPSLMPGKPQGTHQVDLAGGAVVEQINFGNHHVVTPEVTGRHVFYNNSAFDGRDPAADERDDQAVDTGKTALQPGGTASFENYTSYSRGINGVIIDVMNLSAPSGLGLDDFEFCVGNDDTPGDWAAGPLPEVYVRPGAGVDGAHRVTLIWQDNAIENEWLEVTVKATAVTGLTEPDVFYFGNAIGESGNSPDDAMVTSADEIAARHNPTIFQPAAVSDPHDFNRDRRVTAVDQIIARHAVAVFDALQLISPTSPVLAVTGDDPLDPGDIVPPGASAAQAARAVDRVFETSDDQQTQPSGDALIDADWFHLLDQIESDGSATDEEDADEEPMARLLATLSV